MFVLGKTNKEFNMRHDWNSLISDDESLLMKHYSKEFFPHADDLVSCPIASILEQSLNVSSLCEASINYTGVGGL